MLYPNVEEIIQIIIDEKVPIVFTSAGNPKTWTGILKSNGIKVVHVVANKKFALKCEEAGVDAIVAEGFEAGGHNGREETTTLVLIPLIRESTNLPLIAAGGISTGSSMMACFALGAEAVQMGTRFVASIESSGHDAFKAKVISSSEGDTMLMMKQLTPVRMMKNKFFEEIAAAEMKGASVDELKSILGRARAKKGMFEGDLEQGELEIGQVASTVKEIKPAKEIVKAVWNEFLESRKKIIDLF